MTIASRRFAPIYKILNVIPLTFVLLSTFTSPASVAQENIDEDTLLMYYGDDELISVVTGSSQPIYKAPAAASVITAHEIKAMGATDLDDVLERVPGLHVSRNNILYNPIYTIRGIHADRNPQVLILINGIPLTNLFVGDRSLMWGGMPVEAIARIEIIRGPGSAVYGADAFAGVINVITKNSEDIAGTQFGARLGSFNTKDAWLLHGQEWQGLNVAFALEYHTTDGQQKIIDADAQTLSDTAFGTNASLAPGALNLQRDNFDMRIDISRDNFQLRSGWQRRRNLGTGAGIAQALDPQGRFSSDRWNFDLTYHNNEAFDNWDFTAQLSYLDSRQEVERDVILFPPGALGIFNNGIIGNPEVYERHNRISLSAFNTSFKNHIIRVGAGYYYGDLHKVKEAKNFGIDPNTGLPINPAGPLVDVSDTASIFLTEGDRKNKYIFIQDAWELASDWELTAGIRLDDYSDFGETVNPRLALVWLARHNLTSKILYGRAFRAPSFAETRNINNPVALGNPDLDPETIQTLELGFDYRYAQNVSTTLNLFYYEWEKIIDFVSDQNATTSTAQNASEQTGYGLEIEFDWAMSTDLHFLANYAFQRSTAKDTNTDAGHAPHHQFYLHGDWEFKPGWHLNPQFYWIANRKRVAGDTRPDVGDYRTFDVVLRKKSNTNTLEFALISKNLFNHDAREPSLFGETGTPIENDLPLAGRSVFAELRYSF